MSGGRFMTASRRPSQKNHLLVRIGLDLLARGFTRAEVNARLAKYRRQTVAEIALVLRELLELRNAEKVGG